MLVIRGAIRCMASCSRNKVHKQAFAKILNLHKGRLDPFLQGSSPFIYQFDWGFEHALEGLGMMLIVMKPSVVNTIARISLIGPNEAPDI